MHVLVGSLHAGGSAGRQVAFVTLCTGASRHSLTGQQTLGTLLSPPHNAGVIGTQLRPAFYVCGGDLNSVHMPAEQVLLPLGCLPSSDVQFLDLWAMLPGWDYIGHRKVYQQ